MIPESILTCHWNSQENSYLTHYDVSKMKGDGRSDVGQIVPSNEIELLNIYLSSKFSCEEVQMSSTNWYNFYIPTIKWGQLNLIHHTKCVSLKLWVEKTNNKKKFWSTSVYSIQYKVCSEVFLNMYLIDTLPFTSDTSCFHIRVGEATISLNILSHLVGGSWVDYPPMKNTHKYILYMLQLPEV